MHAVPPRHPDPTKLHLIYLHGAILTGTQGRATSAMWGDYEYEAIGRRLAEAGFEVISEVRNSDEVDEAARRVEAWIGELKQGGVPSRNIAVIGASMGGIIAGRVSHRLRDPEISYVLLAATYQMSNLPPVVLSGRVLLIHDASDDRVWVDERYLVPNENLMESRTIVTRTGRGHGLLFRPDDAWVIPAVEWLQRERRPAKAATARGGTPLP